MRFLKRDQWMFLQRDTTTDYAYEDGCVIESLHLMQIILIDTSN